VTEFQRLSHRQEFFSNTRQRQLVFGKHTEWTHILLHEQGRVFTHRSTCSRALRSAPTTGRVSFASLTPNKFGVDTKRTPCNGPKPRSHGTPGLSVQPKRLKLSKNIPETTALTSQLRASAVNCFRIALGRPQASYPSTYMLSSNIFMFIYVVEKKGVRFAFCSLQVAAFAPARKNLGLPMPAPASLYEKSQELPEAVCFAWA